jgi:hypothetical protein
MSQYVYTPNEDDPETYYLVDYRYQDSKELGQGQELEIVSITDPEGNEVNVSMYTRMQIEEDILDIEENETEALLEDIEEDLLQ